MLFETKLLYFSYCHLKAVLRGTGEQNIVLWDKEGERKLKYLF